MNFWRVGTCWRPDIEGESQMPISGKRGVLARQFRGFFLF
jgi:hypothetical protein